MKGKLAVIWLVLIVILGAVYLKTSTDYKETISDLEVKVETFSDLQEDLEKTAADRDELLIKLNELETTYKLDLEASKASYEKDIEALKQLLLESNQRLEEAMLPDEASRYMLTEMGIDDPMMLIDDLMALGADIITPKGVLGGTMHFYNIKILNNKWAFARFEDGHYGGYGIYAFDLSKDEIKWEVVIEYTDN